LVIGLATSGGVAAVWAPMLVLGLAATGSAAADDCKLGVAGELPVKMLGGHPLIAGSINGVDATFMADSGAFYSMLTAASAEKFHLRLEPMPDVIDVVGVGGHENTYRAKANEFTLVGLHGGPLHHIEFIVGGNSFVRDADGVIGQNVFNYGDTEFDLANGMIRIMRTTGCAGHNLAYWSGSQAVGVLEVSRTTPLEPHILGTATLNGKKIRVLFDTGASASYLTKRAAERVGVKVAASDGVTSGGVTAGIGRRAVETWVATFESLDLGGELIKNIKLRIGDFDNRIKADLLLGADFFLSHRVYFSNSLHKVFYTYNGGRVFDLSQHAQTPEATSAEPAAPDADSPVDGPGYLRRGMAFAARRDYSHALADFDHAAELDPGNADVFYQRGVARWSSRQAVLAMADFDQALTLNPEMVKALMTRAELRLASGDDKGATADFAAAERAMPNDAYQVVRIGMSYSKMGRYQPAIELYDRWIAANPKDDRMPSALNNRCWARASSGKDLDLALKDCDQALKRGQRSSQMLDSRGLVKLRLGDLDGSIADYKASLELQPKGAYSLYGLGVAMLRKGQATEGDASIQAALAVRPSIDDEFKKIGITREP
jgi:tetratricopeptide (TPR) repeat protein